MKTTLLFAVLSMVAASPRAFAATELEELRARCLAQERQIELLQEQLELLQTPAQTKPEPPAAPATPPTAASVYVVRPGDFLTKISRKTGYSTAEISKLNGLKPTTMLHPGQKLKLPTKAKADQATTPTAATPDSLAGKTHKIQQGETYSSIARKYGVSAQSLIAANPNAKANALRPGQIIQLSEATAPGSEVRPLTSSNPPVPLASATAATPTPSPAPVPAPPRNQPVPAPENPPTETSNTPEEAPPAAPEKKIRSVTIDTEMSYADFAAKHGTTVSRLNDLNGLDLTNSTVLAKGSELYVPAQP